MHVKAIRTIRTARYPTRDQVASNPRLASLTPRIWQANRHVVVALGAIGIAASLSLAQEKRIIPGDIASPSLLSEGEALAIIRAEAKKAGLNLLHKAKRISINIPLRTGKTATRTYSLDETDVKKGVSIDILTYEDAYRLYGQDPPFETPTLAKKIRKSIATKRVLIIGDDHSLSSVNQKKMLRKQLGEFFKWLKAQGVI